MLLVLCCTELAESLSEWVVILPTKLHANKHPTSDFEIKHFFNVLIPDVEFKIFFGDNPYKTFCR